MPTTALRLTLILFAVSAAMPAHAEVGDPTVRTDHTHYAGEGAFQTVEDCVQFATAGQKGVQDKAIALYEWILTHQFHLPSPQEPLTPGLPPDSRKTQYDNIPYDANRARFSYAYGLCGTVHAWNEPYWQVLGMRARRRSFPGHTNSEIEYGGRWHAFDTDMAGLVFCKDGVVAGYADIAKDPSLVEPGNKDIPCYPFAWPGDFNAMKKGWRQVAQGGKWYKMYNSGYAAHPGIVHLRSGETFTRYFDRDAFGGPSKRRFWHVQKGGPFRNWTFVNMGDPEHDRSKALGNASYCNGVFVYAPDLSQPSFRDGTAEVSGNVIAQKSSPKLASRDGKTASVTFRHFSPYVICGDPQDDTNPMTGPATDGLIVSGTAQGTVQLELSVDGGQSFVKIDDVSGSFKQDLTDRAKGRYGWQVRFTLTGKSGLDAVRFETTTQVSQAIYPRLTPGGCEVVYQAGSRGVVPVLPNFGLPEKELSGIEVRALRSANVAYSPRSKKSRYAYKTTNNKPGLIVFQVAAPQNLLEVRAACRFGIRVPPPEGADYHLEISTDGGKTWKRFAQAEIPADNEYSSGWMYGKADVSTANTKTALVRVHLYAGGYQTGLIDFDLYGVHQTGKPQPLTLTYGWKEGNADKTHMEQIPAGKQQHRFRVPTGAKITDHLIRLEAP